MTLALNKNKLDNLTNDIWKSAERLRGKFKAHEYQNVILPMIVIRRLECVLIQWRKDKAAEVAAKRPDIQGEVLSGMVKKLELTQAPFSNSTGWTLHEIYVNDPTLLDVNFRAYLSGFSENVKDIIDHFNYSATVGLMIKNNRLAPILNQYKDREFGPDQLSNLEMGYIYEELLRRFSEQSGEEAGEHLLNRAADDAEKERVEQYVTIHGQELQPSNYAICRADLLIKNDTQAKVYLGNSLIPHDPASKEPGDQLAGADDKFDFMLSNPPFGVTWGGKDGYEDEARKFATTRYKAGMPRTNDGALLFLQTMLAKMKPVEKGGSRIAIVFNGSPLSNGDCGSGESEIRRWILENDWLDCIVMLPDQLFYNTGIFTYVWLLRNEKPASHRGRVMLIDARKQFEKEPKSFGNKRNRITSTHRQWIEQRYRAGWAEEFKDDDVMLKKTADFAFHKVSVVFWQTDEHNLPAIVTEPYTKAFTAANLKKEQEFYASELKFSVRAGYGGRSELLEFTLNLDDRFAEVWENKAREAFADEIATLTGELSDLRLKKRAIKDFLNGLSVTVNWTHRHYVQDDEYIPYDTGRKAAEYIPEFLHREIAKPIIRWQDSAQMGYEILPNKYFYRYQPPTPANELLARFWELEKEAEAMLSKLAAT